MIARSNTLPEGTKEQLVRACRTTIGDELNRVTYVTRDRRECLYRRDDAGDDPDREGHGPLLSLSDRAADEIDARHVTIDATGTCCSVHVAESRRGPSVRTDPDTVANFGEVAAAITTILGA